MDWRYLVLTLLVFALIPGLVKRFRKGGWMSALLPVVVIVFIAYSILGWTLYFLQPRFVYSPTREVSYDPGDLGLAFEKIAFKTEDGLKISSWFVPADNAQFTVLICHGNGGNISHRLDTINTLNELGLNCFIFDYRGYGSSQGKPTEEGTYLDAQAAFDWLGSVKGIPPEDTILFGRSLGGSVAAHLAQTAKPAGLVLESSFTSYVDLGRKFYPYLPVSWFASFNYNTLEYIGKVSCPILVIHSRNDELIPFEFGLRLYNAANEPKEFIEIFGSHNDGFLFSGEVYRQGWSQWLDFVKSCKPAAHAALKRIS